jgi:hypothetical protein
MSLRDLFNTPPDVQLERRPHVAGTDALEPLQRFLQHAVFVHAVFVHELSSCMHASHELCMSCLRTLPPLTSTAGLAPRAPKDISATMA